MIVKLPGGYYVIWGIPEAAEMKYAMERGRLARMERGHPARAVLRERDVPATAGGLPALHAL